MIIEYKRVRPQATPPTRSNPSDAGLDVYYCPENTNGKMSRVIEPGKNEVLQTGLKFGVPHGYMLQVMNRSSMAAKRSLVVGAHCIDSGYDGEVFIDLHNIGDQQQIVLPGTKIAQVVLVPVVAFRAYELPPDQSVYWYPITISDRGDGALGSTGE
jgi:dUTP pyrophosphatase